MTKDLLMQRLIVFRALGFILLSSLFLFLSLFSTSTNAQLQFNITDGQVAPTPIAIANFTNENGEFIPEKWVSKYIDPSPFEAGDNNNNWIVIRYADVLLMYAEALNEIAYEAEG